MNIDIANDTLPIDYKYRSFTKTFGAKNSIRFGDFTMGPKIA